MKEFLFNNWYLILAALISISNIIILLLKKNKVIVFDTAFTQLLLKLPYMINMVESSGLSGEEKKHCVLLCAINELSKLLNLEASEVELKYSDRISEAIEDILSTPKKKEVLNEKENV